MSAAAPASATPQVPPTGVHVPGRRAVVGPRLRAAITWFFCTWPLGVGAFWYWSGWPAAVVWFVITHSFALYGALRANSQLFGPVLRCFATAVPEVWLTIDDGPFPGETETLLETLARHAIHATFFLEGARVRAHPELVRRILAEGHTLANHSYTHPVSRFWGIGPLGARREIGETSAAIQEVAGVAPVGFRPPVGMANGFVHQVAHQLGIPIIGWSARGFDGIDRDPERVESRLLAKLFPGAIVLFHQRPLRPCGASRQAALLDRILLRAQERGYRFVIPSPDRLLVG